MARFPGVKGTGARKGKRRRREKCGRGVKKGKRTTPGRWQKAGETAEG